MKRIALLVLPLILASAMPAAATTWKTALSKHSECQGSVPTNWVPAFAGIGMKAPAGTSQILISYKKATILQVKLAVPGMFKITKTFEDTPTRYWIEYAAAPGAHHWYVLTPNGNALCSAVFDFDNTLSDADAKTMATSVKQH